MSLIAAVLAGFSCNRAPADVTANDACARSVAGNDRFSGGVQVGGIGCLLTRTGASTPEPGRDRLGSDPVPWGLHLGVVGDPATTMAISWRTRDDATLATTVRFGEGDRLDRVVDGYTFTFAGEQVRVHEAWLGGLRPATRYSYRVGGRDAITGRESWSEVASFRTAVAPGAGPPDVDLVLLGDTRDAELNYAVWAKVLGAAAATAQPDLILFSGDAVTLGSYQSEWDDFLRVAEPVLRGVPMVLAHGNHEAMQVNYFSLFAMPGNEENFGLDWGPVHLTVLNDSPLDPGEVVSVAAPFLEADLAAHQGARWKLVMHHQPPWSAGTTHGSNLQLREVWGPIVDRHQVDLVLNGHDHDYQRTLPIRGGRPQPGPGGTTFVVAGSAGAPLYDYAPADFLAVASRSYSWVWLRIRGGLLDATAYDEMGTVIDRFGWSKSPPGP